MWADTISVESVAVEALRYKPEGRGFDSQYGHCEFPLTFFRLHYALGVESYSNKNEYHGYLLGCKGGRSVGLRNLQPSCADCLEIWDPQPPGALRSFPDLYKDCFTFSLLLYLFVVHITTLQCRIIQWLVNKMERSSCCLL